MAEDTEARIGRRVQLRLVLPLALFFLIGSLDRANVAFAALQMNAAIGLSSSQYGFGAGVLFVGYVAMKYPSVMLFERIGLRRWLAAITVTWGVTATGMALISGPLSFYAFRFIIGTAEGGLASGVMLYLSHWAGPRYRATILALPIAAIPISQVIGAPLSGWLIESPNPLGWEGWRWMFLVEGMPAVLLGIAALFYFPDRPDEARWLGDADKAWIRANVTGSTRPPKGDSSRWEALRSPITWICAAIWFCGLAGNYGVMFWLPQTISSLSGLGPTEVGIIVALPWIANAVGIFANARHSDRTQERFFHLAIPFAVASASLLTAYLAGGGAVGLAALVLAGFCLGASIGPFWAVPTTLLKPSMLAVAIVATAMVGSFAGLTIPTTMGVLRDATGGFAAPTFLLSFVLLCGAGFALAARQMAKGMEHGPTAAAAT
ncbi:MAG: MFS transporter [Allosphingosinicella sp.]